jgi:signal transduction histidine kinase
MIEADIPLALVTERILLSALREQDAAAAAEIARERAEFLADASLRFGASLDEELTYAAIAGVALPGLDAWCIVDVIESGGGLRRLAVVHPDPDKQATADALVKRWTPAPQDPIGVPAVMRDRRPVLIVDRAEAAVDAAARDPETLRVLRWLGPGSLLVVPILAHDVLLGAITFVNRTGTATHSAEDVAFGEALAARCAQALEAARLYAAARAAWAEAEAARANAENANATKAKFLGRMSHELRTPLNAIAGYAQILEMGLRGPVTPEQQSDLASIQRSQAHLLGLVDAVLNYAQLEAGRVVYLTDSVPLMNLLDGIESFVAPQMRFKEIEYRADECDSSLIVCAEGAKVRQIIVNLLGNAVKFTPSGGTITVRCSAGVPTPGDERSPTMHSVSVSDTGIGIAANDLESIFDPFIQVGGRRTASEAGVGLGLAISRDLARGMGGDLTVESTLGVGSVFTLTLPAA